MKLFHRLLILLLLSTAAAVGQDNAALRGVVTDHTGAVIANATVEVTNTEKGISRTVPTNQHGEYEVPQLAAQIYSITVTAPGFKTDVRKGYSLQTAQESRLNFQLVLGGSSDQVVVTANASLLQTEDNGPSQVIDEKKVQELPQNGRNALNLVVLAPNVNGTSIAGNPSVNNNYTIDGVQDNDRTTGSPTLKPAEDGVQEFRVLTGQYSAEYGRQSGGQIILTTKSGNNKFHGSLYDYVRNSATDARNYFSAAALPPFSQNQFGGSLGGPIRKNKTFFFGAYEGLRSAKDTTYTATVPTDLERRGIFTDLVTKTNPNPITLPATIPGTTTSTGTYAGATTYIPTTYINTTSSLLLNYLPPATATDRTQTLNNYTRTANTTTNTNEYSIRVDQVLTSKDNLYATYELYNSHVFTPGTFPLYGTTAPSRDQILAITEDHVFNPNLINELRVGYNRWVALNIAEANSLGDVSSAVGIPQGGTNGVAVTTPQTGGVPYVSISGYTSFGTATNLPQSRWDNTFNYIDSLSWNHGKHAIKVGTDIEHFYKHSFFVTDGTGAFSFTTQYTGNAFADYLIGGVRTSTFSYGDPNQHPKTSAAGFYAQDQWSIRKDLTLNYGLRYEAYVPQKESDNKLGTFDPNDGTLLDGQGNRWSVNTTGNLVNVGTANLGNTIYKQPKWNFGPRVGFDYRFLNDKAVLRGGYGIYYDQLVVGNGEYQNYGLGPPYILIKSYTGSSSSQINLSNPFPANTSTGGITPFGINPNLPTPYRQQWSLGIQHEVIHNLLIDVSYLGSNGTHLPLRYNINQAQPGSGTIQSRTPYPLWGAVTWLNDVGTSSYNSLAVKAERRYSNGLSFVSFLTWSKSLDTGTTASSGTSPQNYQDLKSEWGPSSFDVKLRYVATFIDELPFGKGRAFFANTNPVVRNIISGWETTAIFSTDTGSPVNITTSVDVSNTGTSNRPFQVIANANKNAPHTVKQWFNTSAYQAVNPAGASVYAYGNTRRNNVRGPGDLNLDAGLFRNFKIAERITAQLRFEAFNVLNHPSLGNPSGSLATTSTTNVGTFGTISTTSSTARQLQFAGRIRF